MIKNEFEAKHIYVLVILVLVIAAGVFYLLSLNDDHISINQQSVETNKSEANQSEVQNDVSKSDGSFQSEDEHVDMIYVHLCGEVEVADVYELPKGSRLYEAIDLAGGLTDEASESSINLARKLQDGERIYVPSQEDVANGIVDLVTSEDDESGIVNINTATKTQLMSLPGIGESRAKDIMDYRSENGEFTKIEDIMNVSGIKEAMFEKIKERITI